MVKISGVCDRFEPLCLSRDSQKYIVTSYSMSQREVWEFLCINTTKHCYGQGLTHKGGLSRNPLASEGRSLERLLKWPQEKH